MSGRPIYDLRSDTVTKPSRAMRQAMADAEVGDDMSAEDPTVNRLEAKCAELFGKEAAVYTCTATQANQMAVRVHCQPGDELLCHETGHIVNYEAGGPAALSGVSSRTLPGEFGMLDVPQLRGNVRADDQHFVQTKLVCLENTTNMGGGRAWPIEQLARVGSWAHELGLKVHVDGARLFNATVARGYAPRDVGRHVDTIAICFSKGLGCPMGSILVGSKEEIKKARRIRKLLGGALRQAGIVAASAEYALEHNVQRLAEDHKNARQLAERIGQIRGLRIRPDAVETNLVFFDVEPELGNASQLAHALESRGVLIHDAGPQRLRACTHLDFPGEGVPEVGRILAECVERGFRDRPGTPYGGFWRG
jgi:threonine aldolase